MSSDTKREVFNKTNGHCAYCGKTLNFEGDWHIDHIKPKWAGGSNNISNKYPSCILCNTRKYLHTPEEFKDFMKSQIIKRQEYAIGKYLFYLSDYLKPEEYKKITSAYHKFIGTIENMPIKFYYEQMEK